MAYGGGLENRFRLFGERGFESHPLRHLGVGLVGLPSTRSRQPILGAKLKIY